MKVPEHHYIHRGGWLRASVLGANDGIVSTAALLLGVVAAGPEPSTVWTAGIAALSAGAMSMAVGEYVSVSAQRDVEEADLARERRELDRVPTEEQAELASIYEDRGLPPALAEQVAEALHAHDALDAHARDELNIDPEELARPIQAGLASALAFTAGGLVPLVAVLVAPAGWQIAATMTAALGALAGLGWWSARLGGARPLPAVLRVLVGGFVAMAITMAVGALFGTAVG